MKFSQETLEQDTKRKLDHVAGPRDLAVTSLCTVLDPRSELCSGSLLSDQELAAGVAILAAKGKAKLSVLSQGWCSLSPGSSGHGILWGQVL